MLSKNCISEPDKFMFLSTKTVMFLHRAFLS